MTMHEFTIIDISKPADEEYLSTDGLFLDSIRTDIVPNIGDYIDMELRFDTWSPHYIVRRIVWFTADPKETYERGILKDFHGSEIHVEPVDGAPVVTTAREIKRLELK